MRGYGSLSSCKKFRANLGLFVDWWCTVWCLEFQEEFSRSPEVRLWPIRFTTQLKRGRTNNGKRINSKERKEKFQTLVHRLSQEPGLHRVQTLLRLLPLPLDKNKESRRKTRGTKMMRQVIMDSSRWITITLNSQTCKDILLLARNCHTWWEQSFLTRLR